MRQFVILAIIFLSGLILYPDALGQQSSSIKQGSLIGKWKKIAEYSDPGDGSGTFIEVNSDKIVEFKNNGEVIANHSLCYMQSIDVSKDKAESKGKYSIAEKSISANNCHRDRKLRFDIEDGKLIIHYICKEGCAEKYQRVK